MKIIVMGVSGCGKSTTGKLLSEKLGVPFFDGDDFHPRANVEKMKNGVPLTDEDRKPWLETLATLIREQDALVLACSALKESYREILSAGNEVTFVHLHGTIGQIAKRMQERENHFMPPTLLESQLRTLEMPRDAITVDVSRRPDEIVATVLERIGTGL